MEDEMYMISIPANVNLRLEVINGIGVKELIQTGIAGIISGIIAFFINLIFNKYLVAVGFFLVITGATFVAVQKDKNNFSIAGMILNIFNFYRNQRYFEYRVDEDRKM